MSELKHNFCAHLPFRALTALSIQELSSRPLRPLSRLGGLSVGVLILNVHIITMPMGLICHCPRYLTNSFFSVIVFIDDIHHDYDRPKGTRVGSIGMRALPSDVTAAVYKAPPEGISFTFDDDGFCTRLTSAAVMDPLLGNTGGLGGVYGLLYATLTPASALKTRSLNGFFSRASKSLLKGVTGMGADGFKMSDGRVVNTLPGGSSSISLPSSASPTKATATSSLPKLPQPPAETAPPNKPFFAADAAVSTPQRPTIVLPKMNAKAKAPVKPPAQPAPKKQQPAAATRTISTAKKVATMDASPADPVTEAFNNAFGIGASGSIKQEDLPPPSKKESAFTSSKALELRNAAAAARAEVRHFISILFSDK